MLLRFPYSTSTAQHTNEPHHPAASSTSSCQPQRFGQMELYQRGENDDMADIRIVSMACDGTAVLLAVKRWQDNEGGILDPEKPR